MIDLTNFTDKEEAGLATLTRITEDALAVSTKRFDPTTGEELTEEVVGGNIKEYTDKKAELEAQIAEIDAFIAKFEALTPQNE
jgi:hypothetical protein